MKFAVRLWNSVRMWRAGAWSIWAGGGEKIYFDKGQRFSLVCIQGLKFCPNIIGDEDPDTASGGLRGLFYVIGPGSLIDLHFNFGFRFK